ncbi:Conserved hypothetical protein [Prochlorococcus marinus str. MIT 9313]|uniref:Uncharacterized protein n=1 Tax=Prochlorococcus marinus (strain MIT 9313) TaxID=74547 RepID=B9ES36_PROMM|nr:Conserved hypothetical protein [Prochlorococcus marinus str. MIT 9313]
MDPSRPTASAASGQLRWSKRLQEIDISPNLRTEPHPACQNA